MTFSPSSLAAAWKRPAQLLLIVAVLLALAACQSVNRLREAQDSFDAAAEVDNRTQLGAMMAGKEEMPERLKTQLQQKLNLPSEDMLADANKVRSGYAAALLSLKKMSNKDKSTLKADRLWGAALTLKAMTEWRLGLHEEALRTAETAEKEAKDQVFPRDEAILLALPGLIKIDLAYARIAAMVPGQSTNVAVLEEMRLRLVGMTANPKDKSAVEDLHSARAQAGSRHPVNLYLIQSQLAAFRNYQVACFRIHGRNPGTNDVAKWEAQHNLYELQVLLNELKAGGAGTNIVEGWKLDYNIVPMPR
jgi:hypothetical protein